MQSLAMGARAALPVAAVAWAVLIVAAPWAGSTAGAPGVVRWTGAGTYLAGSVICHQRPDRSFHTDGVRWPVCARCSGLYLGGAAGVLLAWLAGRRRAAVPFGAWRRLLLAMAAPTAATLALEWWNPAWSSGLVRALASAPLGAAFGVLLAASMSFRVD
jgi:hypothetical protein